MGGCLGSFIKFSIISSLAISLTIMGYSSNDSQDLDHLTSMYMIINNYILFPF